MELELAKDLIMQSVAKLVRLAQEARLQAYAPHSKYMVGAAILTKTGGIYAGCNVEAADYDGTHAEEAALCVMVMGGERSPIAVVAFGALEGQEPTIVQPCGKCRQKLFEFASLSGFDLLIAHHALSDRLFTTRPLSDLLKDAFGPADIGVDLAKYRR